MSHSILNERGHLNLAHITLKHNAKTNTTQHTQQNAHTQHADGGSQREWARVSRYKHSTTHTTQHAQHTTHTYNTEIAIISEVNWLACRVQIFTNSIHYMLHTTQTRHKAKHKTPKTKHTYTTHTHTTHTTHNTEIAMIGEENWLARHVHLFTNSIISISRTDWEFSHRRL